MELPKTYNPRESEKKWQEFWEKKEIYKFDPKSKKPIYSIDTPPPTVSGDMHVGHAFSYSQEDFIARFQRMQDKNVFYPFGTDDNGLATERLIEKLNGVKSRSMERKAFVKLCLDTLEKIRPSFVQDWKNLGMSCDFSIFYSTINDHCQRIAQKSFIDLYKKGREYRKEAPTIWCSECQTAIAQVELKDREFDSFFSDIIFKVGKEDLIIATTRPELLPSCVAIFYHPDDKRYKKFKGKKAKVPLFNQEVPIIEDAKVDQNKGTGIVMCCTFGDIFDIEWWYSHKLPLKISFTSEGKLDKNTGKYGGMAIKEARKSIIKDLEEKNLLIKKIPIKHTVNVHERCGTEVEFLVTKQWFIRYLDLKEKFIEIGKKINWHPDFMRHRYENWIKGLNWDWCISRQRYFGVPFPLWYCKKCGEVILADEKDLPVDPLVDKPKTACKKCKSNNFEPEKDVLDTWATSSLTPQLAIELIKDEKLKQKLYPMDLRPQAHDIITFWLFNTVVKSHLHYDKMPWHNVAISGYVLNPHGKKLSKSGDKAIHPREMIKEYSADALRFWAASSKLGEDLPYQEKDIITGQKTIIKLWNASKFSLMHLKDYNLKKPKKLEMFDRWLLTKLSNVIKECTETFGNYEYIVTKLKTENLFWKTFCDHYLEIIKDRLYNEDKRGKTAKESAQYTLYTSLLSILKLFAPIMPYITEEIYQYYFNKKEKLKSIHISKWPEEVLNDKVAEKVGDKAIEIIDRVRKFKAENKKSLKEEIILTLNKNDEKDINPLIDDLKAVTNAKEIRFSKEEKIEL